MDTSATLTELLPVAIRAELSVLTRTVLPMDLPTRRQVAAELRALARTPRHARFSGMLYRTARTVRGTPVPR